MTHEISLDEASVLKELLKKVPFGGELVLTQDRVAVAKLTVIPKLPEKACRRKAGFAKGSILYIADDFDEYLELVPSSLVVKMQSQK